MAANAPRPNYFVLLDVDPDATWDDSAFQALLTRKKAEWTRNARNPKNAKLYNSYLEMVPRIVQVMTDPAQRAQEAAAARRVRTEEAARHFAAFEADFDLRAAKGFIPPSEVTALAQQYPGIDEARIRALMAERGIGETPPTGGVPVAAMNVLDPSTMRNIQDNLTLLDKRNLYDFLGLAAGAPTPLLLERARAIYADNQKQGDKTARVTASSELAGQAISIFRDEASRQRYDNALARLAYDELGAAVARLVEADNMLYAPQYARLMQMARERGLDLDKASEHIRARARELKAAVEIGSIDDVRQQQRCPNCDTLNDRDARNCQKCGTPLRIRCPNCGQEMPTEFRACTSCGFPIGNMMTAIQQMQEGIALAQNRQPAEAIEKLRAALQLWSPADGRTLNDNLTQEIVRHLRAAEAIIEAQNQQAAALRRLIAERRFYEARALLGQLNGAGNLKAERERIDSAIRLAEERLRQAASAPDPNEAARLYLTILDDCADCAPALQALARIPLAPPQALSARQGNEVVSLEWGPSSSAGARYAVVRRADVPPSGPRDGDLLATLATTRYDDLQPEIGRPLHYAVFAERAGMFSREAARLETPVLLVRGVPQPTLTAQVDDGSVRLSWDPPPNTTEVIVTRSEAGPPPTPADGERIPVSEISHAEDRAVINGRTYHYSVFAIFRDGSGRPVYAPGAFISATPEAAPRPIDDLKIHAQRTPAGHELRLSWTPPEKGTALILQSDRSTGLRSGQIIPEYDLRLYGTPRQGSAASLTLMLETGRTAWFVPVVLFKKTAYIGPEQYFTGVDDVTNLTVRNEHVALVLTWDWPAGCDRVIVAYANDRFPEVEGRPRDGAVRVTYTRAQYDRTGAFAIPNPTQQDYYIVVYGLYNRNGETVIAPGQGNARRLVALRSRIAIAYEIARPRGLFSRGAPALALTISGSGRVPALLLVRKQGGAPINKGDGDVIHRVPAFDFDGPVTSVTEALPPGIANRPNTYARLFLEEDALYDTRGGNVRIDHPLPDKLRLS